MFDLEMIKAWHEYNEHNLPLTFAEFCYQQGREDMLTEIKAKARKYHRGKSEPVEFVIYDYELEELKEQK